MRSERPIDVCCCRMLPQTIKINSPFRVLFMQIIFYVIFFYSMRFFLSSIVRDRRKNSHTFSEVLLIHYYYVAYRLYINFVLYDVWLFVQTGYAQVIYCLFISRFPLHLLYNAPLEFLCDAGSYRRF